MEVCKNCNGTGSDGDDWQGEPVSCSKCDGTGKETDSRFLRGVVAKILQTEYSAKFDQLRKDRMAVSFYKYGPAATNYQNGYIKAIESLEERLKMYKDSGNTEFLTDIANFAMIEFMYPQHKDAHFKVLDDGKSHIVGMGINEVKRLDEE